MIQLGSLLFPAVNWVTQMEENQAKVVERTQNLELSEFTKLPASAANTIIKHLANLVIKSGATEDVIVKITVTGHQSP